MPVNERSETVTLCTSCLNLHSGTCLALMDSENDCQCRCDSGIPGLEGMTYWEVDDYLLEQLKVTQNNELTAEPPEPQTR